MAPEINYGWTAQNEVQKLEARVAVLEHQIEQIKKTIAHLCPDKSDDI